MAERAIILVAGASRRLAQVTGGRPKSLMDVGGKPILYHQLDAVERAGVREVALVVGYHKEEVITAARQYPGKLSFRFFENHVFDRTNTLYSLYLARDVIVEGDFFYLNGDVVFDPEILQRLAAAPLGSWLAVDTKTCAEEEVKAQCQGDRVVRLSKEVPPAVARGEFIGIARFAISDAPLFVASLDKAVAAGEVLAYFELAVERILDQTPVRVLDVSDLAAVEIDFPEDLAAARDEVYPRIRARYEIPSANSA